MTEKTDQESLLRDYDLQLVSMGPSEDGWIGQYYKCPLCGYFVDRSKYDRCDCGNISIDVDYCRISVKKCPESEVAVFNVVKKSS